MDIKRTIEIRDESQTREFGLALGRSAQAGQVIGLIGDLGAGKTTLTKYIAEGLGIKENVSSPTFNVIKEYRGGRLPLYHFDVYRLGGAEELFDLGAEEYFDGDGLCVVEWADLAASALPEDARFIYVEYGGQEGERIYKCTF